MELVHAGPVVIPHYHIWQETPADLSSEEGKRDTANVEAACQGGRPLLFWTDLEGSMSRERVMEKITAVHVLICALSL
jgi:hypothetical protein